MYVTGGAGGDLGGPFGGGFSDTYLRKYDASGNVVWTKQQGANFEEHSEAVSADGLGNVYIAGTIEGHQAFVTRYDSSGVRYWTNEPKNLSGLFDGEARGVSSDGLGNVYVAGFNFGMYATPSLGGEDLFLTKFDQAGTEIWKRQYGTSTRDLAHGVFADSLGSVYVVGQSLGTMGGSGNAGSFDAVVSKFGSSGNLIWTRQFGSSARDSATAVIGDGMGNIYVAGTGRSILGGAQFGGTDIFLLKLDSAGNVIWSQTFGSSGTDLSSALAIDAAGAIYVVGDTTGNIVGTNAGGRDALIVKFAEVPEPATYFSLISVVAFMLARRSRRESARTRGRRHRD
ncbi:MAG: PEP-CTERM sorting domain-containing protein [Pirellulales bacterium]